MPVRMEYAVPKGNTGMTLYSSRNDDSTVALPTMGFQVFYNNSPVSTLYTSGNTWIGFGAAAEHLTINRRDTSCNSLYYALEGINGIKVFRVRFEGNSSYSSWGSNNLVWEFEVYEDGVFQLMIEKTPNSASDGFVNPDGAALSLRFETGKSYVFLPQNKNGTNFMVQEGSYMPCIERYVMVDAEGVKTYQESGENKGWVTVAEGPVTEALLLEHGVDTLPNDLTGLLEHSELYYYTDDPDVLAEKEAYVFEVSQVVTSKPQPLIQAEGFTILEGKVIASIEVVTSLVDGSIRLALSFNGGNQFYTYSKETLFYEEIDISNIEEFLQHGIDPVDLAGLDYGELNGRLTGTLHVAYLLNKPTCEAKCKLKAVKISYEE